MAVSTASLSTNRNPLLTHFEGIDLCASLRFHLAETRVIEAGKPHENAIQVAHGHLINYFYFLCSNDAHYGRIRI